MFMASIYPSKVSGAMYRSKVTILEQPLESGWNAETTPLPLAGQCTRASRRDPVDSESQQSRVLP